MVVWGVGVCVFACGGGGGGGGFLQLRDVVTLAIIHKSNIAAI